MLSLPGFSGSRYGSTLSVFLGTSFSGPGLGSTGLTVLGILFGRWIGSPQLWSKSSSVVSFAGYREVGSYPTALWLLAPRVVGSTWSKGFVTRIGRAGPPVRFPVVPGA